MAHPDWSGKKQEIHDEDPNAFHNNQGTIEPFFT
jgi:hypothetical protein